LLYFRSKVCCAKFDQCGGQNVTSFKRFILRLQIKTNSKVNYFLLIKKLHIGQIGPDRRTHRLH